MNPSSATVLRGVLPVFQTPWLENETIDWETLEKELHWLLDCGADGIVLAMVSEVLRLSCEERETLAAFACRTVNGRGSVVISVGAESTPLAVRFARHAEAHGADAIMAIPPVSIALGDDELLAYYSRLLDATSLPLIVQDASGYVGRPMPIALQARILDEFGPERVLYKPEATPIGPKLSELRDGTGGRARIFEGTGGTALVDSHRRGIVGTMPGADLVRGIVALWRSLEAGDHARADAIHAPISAIVALASSLDGFLAIEKHLLVRQGIFSNTLVRGPVGFRLDDETRDEASRQFDRLLQLLKESAD